MGKFLVKIPVDYVKNDNGDNTLQYRIYELSNEDSYKRYSEYTRITEEVFMSNKPSLIDIKRRIKTYIDLAIVNNYYLDYFMNNQWILKYADKFDLNRLLSCDDFEVSYFITNYPKSGFIKDNTRRIYEEQRKFPVWEKSRVQYQKEFINLLIIDDKDTFDDKLRVMIGYDNNFFKNVIRENIWLLMFSSDEVRKYVMDSLKIPYEEIDVIDECANFNNGSAKLGLSKKNIPSSLAVKYLRQNDEIINLFIDYENSFEQNLLSYYYNHSKTKLGVDENDLLRNNLWILEFASVQVKLQLYDYLGVSELRKSKKKITLNVKLVGNASGDVITKKLVSDQVYIDEEELMLFDKLNIKLHEVLPRGLEVINEEAIAEFINSDEHVLKYWPWLSDLVINPKLVLNIMKDKKRK